MSWEGYPPELIERARRARERLAQEHQSTVVVGHPSGGVGSAASTLNLDRSEDRQPTPNADESLPEVVDLVKTDLDARREQGTRKYGQALRPFNGRDALRDAYGEALDLCCYLRQRIEEEETP